MAEQPNSTGQKPASQSSATLCPYCGHVQMAGDRCGQCKGLFEPLSRQATQICMGPWFIRDTRNPFKPGCSYDVISKMIKAGKIKPNTVMRGPTTMQFWQVARNVPGLAHLVGFCHECNASVSSQDAACPKCGNTFEGIPQRNELGLLYRTEQEAHAAQESLDKQIQEATGTAPTSPAATGKPGGGDLLSQALGSGGAAASAPPPAQTQAPQASQAPQAPQAGGSAQATTPAATAAGTPAAAQPAQPAAAAPSSYEMFDFGPEEASDGFGGEPTVQEMQRRDQRMSVWTWVLVGINAVVLLLVVVIFYLMSLPKNTPTPGTTDGTTPTTIDGSTDGSSSGSSTSTGGNGSSSSNGGTGASADGTSLDPTSQWDKQWSNAMKLENDLDFEGALLTLNKLKNAPDEARRKKLAVAIDRIQEKRQRDAGESKIFD